MSAVTAGQGLSGLDFLQAMLDGRLAGAPFAALLGLEAVELQPGRVVFRVQPGEHHYNPVGLVHGGLLASLLDSVMGCAVHSTLPAAVAYATIELKVSLLAPVTAATGVLIAVGSTLQVGRRVAFAQGRVEDSRNRLVAHGTTSCAVFAAPTALPARPEP